MAAEQHTDRGHRTTRKEKSSKGSSNNDSGRCSTQHSKSNTAKEVAAKQHTDHGHRTTRKEKSPKGSSNTDYGRGSTQRSVSNTDKEVAPEKMSTATAFMSMPMTVPPKHMPSKSVPPKRMPNRSTAPWRMPCKQASLDGLNAIVAKLVNPALHRAADQASASSRTSSYSYDSATSS